MKIPSEVEYNAAVSTALECIEKLEQQLEELSLNEQREPFLLRFYCDEQASFSSQPLHKLRSYRLYIKNDGVRYPIKLYPDTDSVFLGGLSEIDSSFSLGLEINKMLIKDAQNNAELFEDLCELLADNLIRQEYIAPMFMRFMAAILKGKIKKPNKPKQTRKPNLDRKLCLLLTIDYVHKHHLLTLTRSEEYKYERPNRSILDAIAEAMSLLGHKCKYSTLKRNIYPSLKYLEK